MSPSPPEPPPCPRTGRPVQPHGWQSRPSRAAPPPATPRPLRIARIFPARAWTAVVACPWIPGLFRGPSLPAMPPQPVEAALNRRGLPWTPIRAAARTRAGPRLKSGGPGDRSGSRQQDGVVQSAGPVEPVRSSRISACGAAGARAHNIWRGLPGGPQAGLERRLRADYVCAPAWARTTGAGRITVAR